LKELGFTREITPKYFCVKESVFPFSRFPGVDILLSPEMKSTGEVMGIDEDLGIAYAKSQMAAQPSLPLKGKIFLSVRDSDKQPLVPVAEQFKKMGFEICATSGTAKFLEEQGIPVQALLKISEGRPNVLDLLKNDEIVLISNTPSTKVQREDEKKIRLTALHRKIPIMTTITGGSAAAQGIEAMRKKEISVTTLQEYHSR
jgi:carbamoyl-phosphate synthase large subunit